MKKILGIIVLMFLLGACSNKLTNEEKIYNEYISDLKKSVNYESNLPFDLEIYVDKIVYW